MNLPYKPKDRRVVPNWRYYESTLAAGELNNWKVAQPNTEQYSIDDYVEQWKSNPSLYRAGDLISAAITNDQKDNDTVKEAATFIMERVPVSTHTMIEAAKSILSLDTSKTQSTIEIDRLRECTAINDIHNYIHYIKHRLQLMPYNPFLYVDLSRAYLLLGQRNKAEDAIKQALHFNPTDRFVARSAARFYLHLHDKDKAYDAIRAKGAAAVDPWLMASEISINMLRGKSSNYIKRGYEIIDSGHCSPFGFTELASSIGTLELTAGANRKSNKLFRKALIDPNDNSLAQVRWVNSFEPISMKIDTAVRYDYEVKTYDAILRGDFDGARHEAVSWICDMPFAHKPVNVGYNICVSFLHDFPLASAILDVGLRTDDSNPQLLNNKAYCSARSGNIEEAKNAYEKLSALPIPTSPDMEVCAPATEGLILYRNHMPKEGALKYQEAIKIAKNYSESAEYKNLYKKAVLNYCRERLVANDGDAVQVMKDVSQISIDDDEVELKLLLNEVKEEYNKRYK